MTQSNPDRRLFLLPPSKERRTDSPSHQRENGPRGEADHRYLSRRRQPEQ